MCVSMNDINYLEISRDILYQNASMIKKYVQVPIIGVLKCNGYGVSIVEAALAWKKCGITMFGVSQPQEALELRNAGFTDDILLLAPVGDAATLNLLLEQHIILTVTGMKTAQFYLQYAQTLPIRVHVAIDCGMGRFGIHWTDMEQICQVYQLSGLLFEGIFSHFSASFEKKCHLTQQQLERFTDITYTLISSGYEIGIRHIANSCAALRFPETRLDAVRIGSALIGRLSTQVPISLQPAGVFKAQVVDCKTLFPGDTTGYASICKIRKRKEAIIVAIGRENGFEITKTPDNLSLRNFASYIYHIVKKYLRRPYVVYNNQKLYLIGRIGNQYSLFDASNVDIQPGDYVTSQIYMLFPNQRKRFVE